MDLFSVFKLGRKNARILQYLIGKAEVFGYVAVVFKHQRPAGAVEIFKLPLLNGFRDMFFRKTGTDVHKTHCYTWWLGFAGLNGCELFQALFI